MMQNNLFEKYHSCPDGLSAKMVQENAKFGQNVLQKAKKQSFFVKFLKQFENLMVMVLLVSAIVSTVIALATHHYEDLFEGALIFVIVVANALIGVVQEQKAEVALEEIAKLSAPKCKVVRDGKLEKIDTEQLVVGDLVVLSVGDSVPADIILTESTNLKTDESSLTGESAAVYKDHNKTSTDQTPLAEKQDMCYKGTNVTYGSGKGIVVSVGKDTQMGKISGLLSDKPPKSPLEKNMERIGKVITYGVLIVVGIVFLSQLLFSSNFNFLNSFLTAVALAVAAIPESLPAVITIIMALGVEKLAKHGAIIKSLASVEALGSCTCIATDKTGTLTQNKMTVKSVYCNGRLQDIKNWTVDKTLLDCACICNNAILSEKGYVGDATETSLMNYAKELKYDNIDVKRFGEIPFDSKRKIMSVLAEKNSIKTVYAKGATDYILKKCTHILKDNKIVPIDNDDIIDIYYAHDKCAKSGQRIIALAKKDSNELVEENLVFLGFFGISDPPREEVKPAIVSCKKAGLKPIMITGDHPATALAIAKELGIASKENQVITGAELDRISDKNLPKAIKNITVFARVSPEHKTKIVKALQKIGNIVGFTGDGINDAPSIKQADIGVCMGSGTDVSKSAADLIVSTNDYSTIVLAIEQGRTIFQNIQKVLLFLLSTNMVEVIGIFVAAIIMPNSVFLLPSQILFVNLVTDSLPAFALGLEKPEKDIMEKPPRNPKSTIFSGIGWPILIQGFLQSFVVLIMFTVCNNIYGNKTASTMIFVTICLMQIIHAINCKTMRSIFKVKLFENKTFWISFVALLGLIISICAISPLAAMFDLAQLTILQWTIVVAASISIVPIVEICKYFSNHKHIFKFNKKLKIFRKKMQKPVV